MGDMLGAVPRQWYHRTAMSTSVPMLDLHRQFASIRDEVLPAVERVCTSQQYILGPEVTALEREISEFIGCADTVACSSSPSSAPTPTSTSPSPCSS